MSSEPFVSSAFREKLVSTWRPGAVRQHWAVILTASWPRPSRAPGSPQATHSNQTEWKRRPAEWSDEPAVKSLDRCESVSSHDIRWRLFWEINTSVFLWNPCLTSESSHFRASSGPTVLLWCMIVQSLKRRGRTERKIKTNAGVGEGNQQRNLYPTKIEKKNRHGLRIKSWGNLQTTQSLSQSQMKEVLI